MPTRLATLALVALALLSAGCGTSDDDQRQVRSVVERFYDALRHDDGKTACEQLSEATLQQLESQSGQTCDAVITRLSFEGGAVVGTHVYLTNAEAELRSGEHAFLSRERSGWRLTALACQAEGPPRERPLDCEVEA